MNVRDRVWIRDGDGVHASSAVPPAVWHGEHGCVIGPFSSAESARVFLRAHRARPGSAHVFPARSAYYVDMRA